MGYVVRCAVLNAAWYGVPQTRERLIIVGFRDNLGITPTFPPRQRNATLWRGNLGQSRSGAGSWEDPEFFVPFDAIATRELLLPAVTVSEAFDGLPPFIGHLEAQKSGDKYRTLRDEFSAVDYASSSLNDYGRLMRDWCELAQSPPVTHHYCRWTPRDFETFRRMAPGDRYPDALRIARQRYEEALLAHKDGNGERPLREDFVPPYPEDSFEDKWRKLDPRHPSWTVTAHLARDTYSHIHFDADQARAITVREAARLQSFPDGFRFAGNTGEMYRQIGNAVPPLLGLALGEAILEQLEAVDRASRASGDREWNTADPQQSVMTR
jgi:DNA (cytosine-5)-methyltransferase 1